MRPYTDCLSSPRTTTLDSRRDATAHVFGTWTSVHVRLTWQAAARCSVRNHVRFDAHHGHACASKQHTRLQCHCDRLQPQHESDLIATCNSLILFARSGEPHRKEALFATLSISPFGKISKATCRAMLHLLGSCSPVPQRLTTHIENTSLLTQLLHPVLLRVYTCRGWLLRRVIDLALCGRVHM